MIVSGQNNQGDKYYLKAEKYYNIIEPTSQTDSLALKNYLNAIKDYLRVQKGYPRLVDAFFKSGTLYQSINDQRKAINSYLQSIKHSQKVKNSPDSGLFKNYLYAGNAYYILSNFDSAKYYFDQAEKISLNTRNISSLDRLYNSLGALYYESGNYLQSENYFEKAISIINSQKSIDKDALVYLSNNLASAFRKLGHYNKALKLYKDLLPYEIGLASLKQNIGHTYLRMGKNDSALMYLSQVRSEIDPVSRIRLFNDFANAYFNKKEYQQAGLYFNRALKENITFFGLGKNVDRSSTHLGKSSIQEQQGNYRKALEELQLAIINLTLSFEDKNIYTNPPVANNAISVLELYHTLIRKAAVFRKLGSETKEFKDLEMALKTYQLALGLADYIRKSYDSDEAKLFFGNDLHEIFEQAINTAFDLYDRDKSNFYLETAFTLSEMSKGAVLYESIRNLEIKNVPGVPTHLIEQEKRIKQKITLLMLKLSESQDTKNGLDLRNQIRDFEIELGRVQKQFEKNETYYHLKYNSNTVSRKDLQSYLKNANTAAISYFMGSTELFTFFLSPDGFSASRQPIDNAFIKDLYSFKNELYELPAGSKYNGYAPSFRLFQKLVYPFIRSISSYKKLLIIPDGELNYIPFEALNSTPKFDKFILHDYAIAYAYSFSFLGIKSLKTNNTQDRILAMAPFTDRSINSNIGFLYLPASGEEIKDINGDRYYGKDAQKKLFLKIASNYNIIHLATHAKTDVNDPLNAFISFYPYSQNKQSDFKLFTSEIYNMRLNNLKLVILSACETGNGKLVNGEGIMSLARAFAYAGCPNIISTLWNANDESSSKISILLHKYLKEGYSAEEALRKAKLTYLNDPEIESRFRTPNYWANFIFVGEIQESSNDNLLTYVSLFFMTLLLIVILYWGVRKKKVQFKAQLKQGTVII
ncbi:CHAT domain-containing protein [Solitalea sp. MAHUQ-68]|uniref:CHAT domain-containing protein n=1 Tax=Solitalea agri TaxID=2953739 RepID=A0A9X2JD80_9SPHI|nr:CHAT domain-containing protein [Solitalea agri]MCO4292600.1 CHAT domain-containing protein [Solitalea agri]